MSRAQATVASIRRCSLTSPSRGGNHAQALHLSFGRIGDIRERRACSPVGDAVKLISRFNEIARDDASVKLIFDHIRNLGLCALMVGAADYVLAHPEVFAVAPAFALGSILFVVGGALVILNALHALLKVNLLKSRVEQVLLYLAINAIGPVTIAALMLVGPFRN